MNGSDTVKIIVDNIIYMLRFSSPYEPNPVKRYLKLEQEAIDIYRKELLPLLRQLITVANQNQASQARSVSNCQFEALIETLKVYQSVICQMGNFCASDKRRHLEYYRNNQYKITDHKTKECLQKILEAQSMIQDYHQSRQNIFQIHQKFKDYIYLDLNHSLSTNIFNIRGYLDQTGVEQRNQSMPFNEITSLNLLLRQSIEQFKQKVQLSDYQEHLNNIRIDDLRNLLKQLIKSLNEQIKQQKQPKKQIQVESSKSSMRSLDQNQLLMQIFPQIVQNVSYFIEDKKQLFQNVNQHKLVQINQNFAAKILKTNQLEHKFKQIQRQRQNLIERLEQTEKLKQSLINQKDQIIKRQAIIYEQTINNLKTKCQELTNQKNDLLTEVHQLKHKIDDQSQSIKRFYQKKIAEEIEKVKKIINNQKQNQIEKIEERRRNEKAKLVNQNQQLSDELEELKGKYFRDVGKKLLKSRFDLSYSKIDKSFLQSFLQQSILQESSIGELKVEENQDVPEQILNQLNIEFKKQFEEEVTLLKKQNSELLEEINLNKSEIQMLKAKFQELQIEKKSLILTIQTNSEKYKEIQSHLTDLKKRYYQLTSICGTYEKTINQYQNVRTTHSSECKEFIPALVPFERLLFQGYIFEQDDNSKAIIMKHLAQYTKSRIVKTRILFEYSRSNKSNFHSFIDNKKHLLCVVKTKKVIIAAYYPGQLSENKIMNEGGLLISITNDKNYKLLENSSNNSRIKYRGMTYDAYYVVFGNAELRIRSGENKVFSNFGIQNGYFNYQNSSREVDVFLRQGNNREVEFEFCQFYQLVFESEIGIKRSMSSDNENIITTI